VGSGDRRLAEADVGRVVSPEHLDHHPLISQPSTPIPWDEIVPSGHRRREVAGRMASIARMVPLDASKPARVAAPFLKRALPLGRFVATQPAQGVLVAGGRPAAPPRDVGLAQGTPGCPFWT